MNWLLRPLLCPVNFTFSLKQFIFTFSEENVDGVPEFWLTIFKNVDMLSDMVQEHDEPILSSLQDIKVNFQEANPMVNKIMT